ncbi:MAG TPA: DUF1842 domain-containing protein [Actinomycetota bacterium]|nr:DUF1842 domain-containing protein [Actinomycetota bacterium]
MSATAESINVGLFQVSYEVGSKMPGAPMLGLKLLVDTPTEQVTGMARTTQVTAPPFTSVTSSVKGDFTYMATMSSTHILVVATGYPILSWPQGGGIGPVILPNFQLRMVLEDDWQSGTASYKYTVDGTTWKSVDNAPVKAVDATAPTAQNVEQAVLTPGNVEASWADCALTIRASGTEDGYTGIRVDVSPAETSPPIYQVVAQPSPAIGLFPYDVSRTFPAQTKPDSITFRMEGGDKSIPVT